MNFIRSIRGGACALAFGACLTGVSASADDGHDLSKHNELHFSHPLIAESPSPDTKIRLDYIFADEPGGHDEEDDGGANRHTVRFEGEYAFAPWVSIEVNLPYTYLEPDEGGSANRLDTVEVGLKFASFAFAEHGLLIGGGIEFGLPTGNDDLGIGSNNVVEIEPFIDFGYKRGRWETVGFLSFGIPANEKGENEVDVELGWNLSFLYHATQQTQLILEFDGENAFGGEEDGEFIVNISPGIKVSPPGSNLAFGIGLSVPLTGDKAFDIGAIASLFYHF